MITKRNDSFHGNRDGKSLKKVPIAAPISTISFVRLWEGELSKVTYKSLKTGIERPEWLQKEDKRLCPFP